MKPYFKLIDAIETITTVNVARNKNGETTYSHMRLIPNEIYAVGEDTVFFESLKTLKVERPYTQQLSEELTERGIHYQKYICKACGGKIKKISYRIIEFIE